MNLGSIFTRHAMYRPDHLAVVFGETRLNYREYNQRINQTANALLALGVQKGDKVATLLPNCLELLEMYWAAGKIGAVVVPLSALLLEGALRSLLRDSDSVLLVTNRSFEEMVTKVMPDLPDIKPGRYLLTDADAHGPFASYHQLQDQASGQEPPDMGVTGDDYFNIMYSSGTTGLPKGIIHTHLVRIFYGASFAAAFRVTPECVTMHAGAIVFNGAMVDLFPTIFQGGTYVLMPEFNPETYIETIAREKVTHVMMVPAQIIAMLNAPNFDPARLQSLQMILALGAPLLMEHKEELTRQLPGRFYELYGLTEGIITVLDKYDYAKKPKSVGVPLPLSTLKIMDDNKKELPPGEVGEIAGSSPFLMPGYYKRPDLTEQTTHEGLLYSGDLGYVDNDGYLYLVDRKKDMIISGGVNVYPRDIEEIAAQHPAVKEVAVFGIPDPKWGETPLAAVTLMEPGGAEEEQIKQWINARVGAKFQRVSAVKIYDDFPRNAAGKTLKREMRQPFLAD